MTSVIQDQPQRLLPAPSPAVLVSTLAINILALAIPLFSIQIYDRIIAQQGRSTLYVLGAGVAVALLLELALRLLRGRLIGHEAALTEARLSARAFAALTGTSLSRLQRTTQGQLLQAFQAIGRLREFHGGQAFVTLLELPFAALYLTGVAYLGGVLVVVPLTLLACFALRAWQLGRSLRGALTDRQRADRQRYDFLAETLAGIHTIKACGAEQRQLRRYEALQQQLDRSNYRAVAISNLSSGDGALFGQLMLGAITLVGAWLAGGGWAGHHLTLGALIACVLLSGRAMQPVQRTLGLWHRFQDGELALRRLETVAALAPLHDTRVTLPGEPQPLTVQLDRIGYTYPAQPALLHAVSLRITAGDTISLTGPAGSGKSTLLRILCGLYAPEQGSMRLGGVVLQQAPLSQLPPGVVYLRQQDGAQDGALRGTVADNLTRGGQVPLATVLPLVRLLDLETDIARLPHGYATYLSGTAADAVPPGFKQRLALARALALPDGIAPRLVIFDGADRGLDTRGYSALLALLGRLQGQATLVLATADANLRAMASRHYRLDQGCLVEIANSVGAPTFLRQPSLGGSTL